MTNSKSQRAREIQDQIRQALRQHWNPIGVADNAWAEDAYDSYVGPVYRLLVSGATDKELIDYLYKTETETMGLARVRMCGHLRGIVAKLREIAVSL